MCIRGFDIGNVPNPRPIWGENTLRVFNTYSNRITKTSPTVEGKAARLGVHTLQSPDNGPLTRTGHLALQSLSFLVRTHVVKLS